MNTIPVMHESSSGPAPHLLSGPRSAQAADLRRQNLSAILRAVMSFGPVARADLAQLTGMATGTVTKLTAALSAAGLIVELDSSSAARAPGRPRIPVAIDDRTFRVIGIHFGLTRTNLCAIDLSGSRVADMRLTHRRRGFDYLVGQAVDAVAELRQGLDGVVLGVGASTGGRVDPDAGVVLDHAALGWHNQPLLHHLERRIGLPVRIASSFRALALAERWLGGATEAADLVQLFVGNVVGAGLILGGRPYRGATSHAGAIEHLSVGESSLEACTCGRHDCLQVVATDVAVLRQARKEGLVPARATLEHLITVARGGNRRAEGILAQRARHVGVAAGTAIELLDPQLVVVSGGVVDAPEYLGDVRAGALEFLSGKRRVDVDDLIQLSRFGTHAISLSSAAVVLSELYQDPMAFAPRL